MTLGIFIMGQDSILRKFLLDANLISISIWMFSLKYIKSPILCICKKKFMRSENIDPHAKMFSIIWCWVLTLRYQDYPVYHNLHHSYCLCPENKGQLAFTITLVLLFPYTWVKKKTISCAQISWKSEVTKCSEVRIFVKRVSFNMLVVKTKHVCF